MRVIVTGGTGLIGHQLVKRLAGNGHEVIVLSRNPRQPGPVSGAVRYVEWDARTANGWGELVNGAAAIVNLAAENLAGETFFPQRWSAERKRAILESRINAGKAVVEAVRAAETRPQVVVQSSAVGYYGVHGDEELTEDTPAGSDFLAEVCKQWEASTAEVESLGVRQAIARTGVVLSTKGGALPRLALPFKLFAGGPLGSGKQQVPWIHIDDEVAALEFLVERAGASGPYNLAAPNPVRNSEFARTMGKVLKRPSFVPAPGFAFNLAFGEVATVILDGQRAVPTRLTEAGFTFQYPTLDAALRDLFQNNK